MKLIAIATSLRGFILAIVPFLFVGKNFGWDKNFIFDISDFVRFLCVHFTLIWELTRFFTVRSCMKCI